MVTLKKPLVMKSHRGSVCTVIVSFITLTTNVRSESSKSRLNVLNVFSVLCRAETLQPNDGIVFSAMLE